MRMGLVASNFVWSLDRSPIMTCQPAVQMTPSMTGHLQTTTYHRSECHRGTNKDQMHRLIGLQAAAILYSSGRVVDGGLEDARIGLPHSRFGKIYIRSSGDS